MQSDRALAGLDAGLKERDGDPVSDQLASRSYGVGRAMIVDDLERAAVHRLPGVAA